MSTSGKMNHEFLPLFIINKSSRDMTLYLEPWGEEHLLPHGEKYIIYGYGYRLEMGFEIEYQDEAIIVTVWKGGTVRLFFNGEEVGSPEQRPIVPDFM